MSKTDYYYFRGMLNELKSQSTDHTANSNHLEILKDTVAEINNNEIGDAQDGLRCYVYGHDEPNGKARALFTDSSHNLKVKDDDLLTKTTSIDTRLDNYAGAVNNSGNLGDGSTQLRAMAIGYDRSGGKARSILVDSAGKVEVYNANVETKLDSILTRQFSINGTQANLMNAISCVAAGTTSSVVDWFTVTAVPKRLQVLVTATASVANTGFEIWASHDNSTYARMTVGTSGTVSMATTNSAGGAINTTGAATVDWACRYLKIIVYSLGTYTATAIGLA